MKALWIVDSLMVLTIVGRSAWNWLRPSPGIPWTPTGYEVFQPGDTASTAMQLDTWENEGGFAP